MVVKSDPSRLFCGGPQVVAGNGSDENGASACLEDCACTGVSRVVRTAHDPLRCIPESSTPARASSFRTHRMSARIAGIWHGVALSQSPGSGRAHTGQNRQDVAGIGALGKRRVDLAVCAVTVSGGSGASCTRAPARLTVVLVLPSRHVHRKVLALPLGLFPLYSHLPTSMYRFLRFQRIADSRGPIFKSALHSMGRCHFRFGFWPTM